MKRQLQTPNTATSLLVSTILKVIDDFFEEGASLKLVTSSLIGEMGHLALTQCEIDLKSHQSEHPAPQNIAISLVTLLDAFGTKLFQDVKFTKVRDLEFRLVTGHDISFTYFLAYR